MSLHDTHYHRLTTDAEPIEAPGTVAECDHCTPDRPVPSPTPVSTVPVSLVSHAVQTPVSRKSTSKK